jgi:O-antigen/teichoic acid export membrane protein
VRFFLTTINSIFYALQKSSVVNFLALCVSVLQLIFVLIFRFESTDDALFWLSFSYIFLSNLPVVIAAIWLFATSMKDCIPSLKHVDKPHVKAVMGIGTVFFICQILYMLIINTNDFLITNLFGPQYTSEYNFYYKLTGLISMVVTLALTPVWSVVTKAQAEGNYKWLKKLYNIIKIVGLAVIVLEFAFVPFLQWIFDIWLGQGKVVVDYTTALAFACFGSVFVYSSMLSTIVCGMAKMKVQTVCYVVGTIVKFTALYLLAPVVQSWTLVVWMNVLVLLPYCIAEHIHLDIRINKLCKMEE